MRREAQAPDVAASGRVPVRVLVIDDEQNIRATLALCLEQTGCVVESVANAEQALAALSRKPFDLAFLDLRLGEESGLDLLPKLLELSPRLAVVVITAHATFETAVEAVKRGARDYLPKPFTPAQIRLAVEQFSATRALDHRVRDLEERLRGSVPEIEFETKSPAMRELLAVVARAAQSEVPVLLRGESGTGKGVVARLLHAQSPRAEGPFAVVNCPTLSDELLASELFGHTRGAFTGAVRDQTGRVEAAEGGTLFLDEIGEIAPALQAKLLRFLQEKQYERLGETRTRRADVRLVAATNRDLEADVAAGRFREDLLYRLNVVELTLPPLRERREDVPDLARHFLRFFAREAGRPQLRFSPATEVTLAAHDWPGNVRELRNAVERAVVLSPGPSIEPSALPGRIAPASGQTPQVGGNFTLDEIERAQIEAVVAHAPSLEEAARILGIDSSTLWRKRKKYEA
jgi:NtrC-family two-component system response regulator AlgB